MDQSLIMLINNFMMLNFTYGHLIIDAYFILTARQIQLE